MTWVSVVGAKAGKGCSIYQLPRDEAVAACNKARPGEAIVCHADLQLGKLGSLITRVAEARLFEQFVPENDKAKVRWYKIAHGKMSDAIADAHAMISAGGQFDVRPAPQRIRDVRESIGVSLSEFADILGCSNSQTGRFESKDGQYLPSYEQIGRLRAFCAYAKIPFDVNKIFEDAF